MCSPWSNWDGWVPHMHWFLIWSESFKGFDCVKLMVDTQRGMNLGLSTRLFPPFHPLANPLHTTNAIWYDISSTGPSLFLSITHGSLSLHIWVCARPFTLSSVMSSKPCWLAFIFPQSPPFLLFPNFNFALCVFWRRPLPYICSAV